jgi:hypothetical protein
VICTAIRDVTRLAMVGNMPQMALSFLTPSKQTRTFAMLTVSRLYPPLPQNLGLFHIRTS